jgi:hypothetical protein
VYGWKCFLGRGPTGYFGGFELAEEAELPEGGFKGEKFDVAGDRGFLIGGLHVLFSDAGSTKRDNVAM